MDYTQNLHLPQFAETDRIHHDDFNDAMSRIDAAVTACGNCRIATGTYTGTGEYGEEHPNTLTFDFAPKVIYIRYGNASWYGDTVFFPGMTRGYVQFQNNSGGDITITWSNGGRTVSWCSPSYAGAQLNLLNSENPYYYIAIG